MTIEPFPSERREPPVNYEAEQALLGAILAENRVIDEVADTLRPEHFAEPMHGQIFDACRTLVERGLPANAVSLKDHFQARDELKDVGGAKYLAELQANFVSILDARHYARVINSHWQRRELIALGEDVIADAYEIDLDRPVDQIREDAEKRIYDLAEGAETGDGLKPLGVALDAAMKRLEAAWAHGGELLGLTTGYKDLDVLTGGMEPGNLIILAGRPSMGKTTLATNMAARIARHAPVALFSLEMSEFEIVGRLLAEASGIKYSRLRRPGLAMGERADVGQERARIADLPLTIDDMPSLSVHQMHARARRLRRKNGLGLVLVDHIGHIRPADPRAPRHLQLGQITKALKAMAKDLQVPVIALCQLNRASIAGDEKRPRLEHLRESGQIEEDADAVWFVHRDAYYMERAEPRQLASDTPEKFAARHAAWQADYEQARNVAEIIVAKQRNGPVDTARVYFDAALMRVANLDEDEQREVQF